MNKLERQYVRARVIHSITAQRCWKLRAKLGELTKAREQYLNDQFGRAMRRRSK